MIKALAIYRRLSLPEPFGYRNPHTGLRSTKSNRPLFGRHEFLIVERRVHRMPSQRGAFYTHGKLTHAGEDPEIAELVRRHLFIEVTRDHAMEFLEELFHLGLGLTLDGLGHHARCRLRNRTPRPFEGHVLHSIVLQSQIDSQFIATKRVVAFGAVIGAFELAKVSRLLVVIENDLLIELAEF